MNCIPPIPRAAPRTSAMAISSLALGISSFILWILTGIPAVVLGTIALIRINRSEGRLKGGGLAIAGIATGGVLSLIMTPVMLAVLVPIFQATHEAALINASIGNMKEIVDGLDDYANKHAEHAYPAAGGSDGQQSQLSWRVHILPFIAESELYDQFHLDEPWDSEHNRSLIKHMPSVFKDPAESLPEGETCYLAVTGPGTVFGDGTASEHMHDIVDGLTKTILLVEADVDQSVIWTKPTDWEFDPNNPTRGLGTLHFVGFLAALADRSVRIIRSDTAPEVVKAMMTRAGRERVDLE